MNKRNVLLLICFLLSASLQAQEALFTILESEINRNYSILKQQEIPAYYISVRVSENSVIGASAKLGFLQNTSYKSPIQDRRMNTVLRVGSHKLDNSHEILDGYNRGVSVSATGIPLDDNSQAIKMALWSSLDDLYKQSIKVYEDIKTNMAVKIEKEDKSPDFTEEIAESYYEKPIQLSDLNITVKELEDKVRKYSAVFDQNKEIVDGSASYYVMLNREYFLDTEGRKIAQNRVVYYLVVEAYGLADDGMELPLFKTFFAHSKEELPTDEQIEEIIKTMSNNISALKKAPVAESYTGPAILSPDASGVFFHEIFGHRIEASRMKRETDARTFKKKINEKVLPKDISVVFDPTQKTFQGSTLSGYYLYDNEGIKAQRVDVVQNGILKDFLMSRTPIEGFLKSNGHGRADIRLAAVSRQSNMFVQSSKLFTEDELRKMLVKEAKSQKKEYGYYIKDVLGGFTTTSAASLNYFNITPLIVFKVYVDGRPDELVRGVNLIGTPLAMFAQIKACGNTTAVFNGFCGAESGSIPVSCISPSLFVKQIETQKAAKSQAQPPLLPRP